MTTYDENWVAATEAKRKWMAENSLYREEDEHSSCGVGLVVSIKGEASRDVVEKAINALKAIWHRGAVDADGKTGDGAGIHIQIPRAFFHDQIRRTGHEHAEGERIAVGQIFLPRTDFAAQERCRTHAHVDRRARARPGQIAPVITRPDPADIAEGSMPAFGRDAGAGQDDYMVGF